MFLSQRFGRYCIPALCEATLESANGPQGVSAGSEEGRDPPAGPPRGESTSTSTWACLTKTPRRFRCTSTACRTRGPDAGFSPRGWLRSARDAPCPLLRMCMVTGRPPSDQRTGGSSVFDRPGGSIIMILYSTARSRHDAWQSLSALVRAHPTPGVDRGSRPVVRGTHGCASWASDQGTAGIHGDGFRLFLDA